MDGLVGQFFFDWLVWYIDDETEEMLRDCRLATLDLENLEVEQFNIEGYEIEGVVINSKTQVVRVYVHLEA